MTKNTKITNKAAPRVFMSNVAQASKRIQENLKTETPKKMKSVVVNLLKKLVKNIHLIIR